MLKNKRHSEILEILKKQSFATVSELAESLYSSMPTVRRDLSALEESGYVKRCHGGAMILDGNTNPPVDFRRERHVQEKLKMCRAAATLISDGETLFLDASTSVFHISDFIEKDQGVTVITNGIPIATKLAKKGITVYATGGRLLKDSLAFVGISAENTASSYNVDTMFFSVASLSADGTLSDWSEEETMLRLEALKNARKRVFLCDFSKINTKSTFKLFSLYEINFFITDRKAPDDMIERYKLVELSSTPAYIYSVGKK